MFRNLSLSATVNGEIPTRLNFRMFFVHQSINEKALLVSEIASAYPIYHYNMESAKITPIHALQLIEQKETDFENNGRPFRRVLGAYRRIEEAESGAVVGSIKAPQELGGTFQLIRVSEFLTNLGVVQRAVDNDSVWVTDSESKVFCFNGN